MLLVFCFWCFSSLFCFVLFGLFFASVISAAQDTNSWSTTLRGQVSEDNSKFLNIDSLKCENLSRLQDQKTQTLIWSQHYVWARVGNPDYSMVSPPGNNGEWVVNITSHLAPYPRVKSEVKQKTNQKMELTESASILKKQKDLLKYAFFFLRERNINVWLTLTHLPPGTWPTTQASALTGNRTSDPLVCRPDFNPLSHTSQGIKYAFKWRNIRDGLGFMS